MAIWLPHTPRPKISVSYLLLQLTMFEIPGGIRELGGQKSMGMGRVTPKKIYMAFVIVRDWTRARELSRL